MINITDFADHWRIPRSPGVSEADLDAFEAAVGFPLTDDLRSLYRLCDGLVLRDNRLRLLPLDEIRTAWMPGFERLDIPSFWRYFPLIDSFDSNPLCVCCASIMSGYVVQVFHDDVAQVKFRSLDSLFAALLDYPDQWELRALPSEMDQPFRSESDVEIGRRLLTQAEILTGETRDDAIRFGIWLLSEAQLDEIIPLLEYPDRQVGYDVEDRLKAMSDPRAQQALDRFKPSPPNQAES